MHPGHRGGGGGVEVVGESWRGFGAEETTAMEDASGERKKH